MLVISKKKLVFRGIISFLVLALISIPIINKITETMSVSAESTTTENITGQSINAGVKTTISYTLTQNPKANTSITLRYSVGTSSVEKSFTAGTANPVPDSFNGHASWYDGNKTVGITTNGSNSTYYLQMLSVTYTPDSGSSTETYTYKLEFNCNIGSGNPCGTNLTYTGTETSHTFTIPSVVPTDSTRTFDYWATTNISPIPSSAQYPAGSTITTIGGDSDSFIAVVP